MVAKFTTLELHEVLEKRGWDEEQREELIKELAIKYKSKLMAELKRFGNWESGDEYEPAQLAFEIEQIEEEFNL